MSLRTICDVFFLDFRFRIYVSIFVVASLLLCGVLSFNLECNVGTSCEVEGIVVTSPNSTVTSINEKDSEFYKGQEIEHLLIRDQTVNFMFVGIEIFFPNLNWLEVSRSNLKSIKQWDLKPFKKIQGLDLSGNLLQSLDGDVFEFNPELMIIDLSANELHYIGKNILVPLTQLEQVDFSNNDCIDRLSFRDGIESLATEIANECSLENISKYQSSSRDLRSLNLQCRFPKYSEISTENLNGRLCQAEGLVNPSPNQTVVTLNGETNSVYDKVSILYIRDRIVKYMPIGMEKFFPHIKTILVFAVKLKAIVQSDLKPFAELETIYIWKNDVEILEDNVFEFNKDLQKVDMSFNKISELNQNIFKPLTKLVEVNFESNKIETLDSNLFEHNPEIRSINFSDNLLKIVGQELLKPLAKLEAAMFEHNFCVDKIANGGETDQLIEDFKTSCTIEAVNQNQNEV